MPTTERSASPFASLSRFLSIAEAGDTLYIRGGTYSGTLNRNLSIAASGASGNPITIAAYPAETPIFNGGANGSSDTDRFWLLANGPYSYFVFDGIKLTNFSMNQNGIITLSNQTSGGTITSWTFRNMDIQQVAPADSSAQFLYLGERFSNLLVQDCIFRGPYPGAGVTGGAGVSAYADDGPGPTSIVVRSSQFIGCYNGYQLYHVSTTGECSDSVFTGCQTNIDLTRHSLVSITDNTGEHGDSADIYDPTYSAYTTASGNVFT